MASNGSWTTVPLEIAKRHTLYGVSGWLYLVALGCILTPLRSAASLGPIYADIDFAALHPTLSAFIVIEIVVNAAVILWAAANVFLLFGKHRLFPRSYAAMLAVSGFLVVGDTVATNFVMDAIGQPLEWSALFDQETIREVGRGIVVAAIWIPYTFISRRVNVTFLNRVRGDDPLLRENVAEVF
jgi:hypothetical protein